MDTIEIVLRLAAALFVGGILGIDRRLRERPAGLRTISLVSIGAALVVMIQLEVAPGKPEDVSRVIQGLITGIGFLGAGVIIHHEAERYVEGLTTAASVWVAAGLGAACGAGLFALTFAALVATLLVLLAGGRLERAVKRLFGDPEGSDRDD